MMKKLIFAVMLPMFCIGSYAQSAVNVGTNRSSKNKLINEAFQRGRNPNGFYEIKNDGKKSIKVEKMEEDILDEGFIVGNYTTKSISRFGDVSTTVNTMQFLPKDEYLSYMYYNLNTDWSTKIEQLNKKGSAYCCVQNTNFYKYDNIYWNGELRNGKLHGSGTGFATDNKTFVFFKATFDEGIPVGETSFKWYMTRNKLGPYDKSQVHIETCNIGKFYDNLASIRVGDNYGFITREAKLAITPSFKSIVSNFANGRATVTNEKEEIIIDRTGKQIDLSARQKQKNAQEEAKRRQEEAKRKQEEQRKELARQQEQIERRRLEAQAEKRRVEKFKNCQPGDIIYYSKDYHWEEGFWVFKTGKYASWRIICYVEQNINHGERLQIRVGDVETSGDRYITPKIDGIKYQSGEVKWIRPLNDKNWHIE